MKADPTEVSSFISDVGFPIAAFVITSFVLGFVVKWLVGEIKESRKEHNKERDEWRQSDKEDRKELTSALNKLERAIAERRSGEF